MRQKKKIVLLIMLVVCATFVSAFFDFSEDYEDLCRAYADVGYATRAECYAALADTVSGGDVNPREDNWYDVEEWEVEFCSRKTAYENPQSSVTETGFLYVSQLAYTIIGEYTDMSNPVTGEELYLYEINYYVYPWENAYNYGVKLSHSSKTLTDPTYQYELVAGNTALAAGIPQSGYKTAYLTEDYDQVKLGVQPFGEVQIYVLTQTLVDKETGGFSGTVQTGVSTIPALAWATW